jgi:hypothetical protein
MHATFKTPLEIIDFKLRKIKKDIKEHLCLKGIRIRGIRISNTGIRIQTAITG